MNLAHSRGGEFRNVGKNLYRYSSNGVYYARSRNHGKSIHRSLQTTDCELAKRRLQEEIDTAAKAEPKLAKLTLSELLRHYVERIAQYAAKTTAPRRSILKILKETWPSRLEIPLKDVRAHPTPPRRLGDRYGFRSPVAGFRRRDEGPPKFPLILSARAVSSHHGELDRCV